MLGRRLLDLDRESDIRVLKSQIDLTARAMRAMRWTPPLWALLMTLAGTGGLFGQGDLARGFYLPLLIFGSGLLGTSLAAVYLRRASGALDFDDLAFWHWRLWGAQIVSACAWGLMPWLLWDAGNPLNHLFLACCSIMVMSGVVLPRGSTTTMFVSSLLPITLLTTLRFALGEGAADYAVAVASPLFALQMGFARLPMVARMCHDARLRFQVEDLARELEETRDEALTKRYEAEAANATKTAFLANMSHELRTPLNAILGFSEIIAQECFGPAGNSRYKDYAADIHVSGAHLLSLINDLLDIAKIEAGRMEIAPHPVDAGRVFDTVLKLVSAKAAEKHQSLSVRVDPAAPPLFADERALKQILINLASNAVKFTQEGGHIEVEAGAARDGAFQIRVSDNGPGIARDKLGKIFTPFSQVDNRYDRQGGGTGLGLALVRGLAELHGGRAWLESAPGIGTSAFVVLPVKREAGTAAA